MGKVVVGWDGSAGAEGALRWAAAEGQRRNADVAVVRSWMEPVFGGPSLLEAWEDPDALERQAKEELEAAVRALADEHPGVTFRTHLVGARPADAVLHAVEDDDLVVVGARGRGGFASLLLGSVSQRVAAEAPATTVVVRGTGVPGGDVLVGVSGGDGGRHALAWAADEARLRGVRLHAVLAWSYLLPEGVRGAEPFRATYTEADPRMALRQIVHEVLGEDPGVEVVQHAPCELAAKALIERSAEAALVVVGPRESSRHARFELGSVSLQVLHHAACPVALVRRPTEAMS